MESFEVVIFSFLDFKLGIEVMRIIFQGFWWM